MPKVKGKMKEEIELDCTKIKGVYSLKKKKNHREDQLETGEDENTYHWQSSHGQNL